MLLSIVSMLLEVKILNGVGIMIYIRSFQLHDVFHLENDNGAEDTPTLIDRKVPIASRKYWVC